MVTMDSIKRIATIHPIAAPHGTIAVVTKTPSERPRAVKPVQFSRPTRVHIPLIHRGHCS